MNIFLLFTLCLCSLRRLLSAPRRQCRLPPRSAGLALAAGVRRSVRLQTLLVPLCCAVCFCMTPETGVASRLSVGGAANVWLVCVASCVAPCLLFREPGSGIGAATGQNRGYQIA